MPQRILLLSAKLHSVEDNKQYQQTPQRIEDQTGLRGGVALLNRYGNISTGESTTSCVLEYSYEYSYFAA